MNRFVIHSAAAIIGFACLVSCSEQESDLQSVYESSDNQLRIVTHTRGGEGDASSVASIFLFNGSSEYVRTLQTDAAGSYTSASASVKLPQGAYTLCALSPSDLSHFQFPATPSPTSVISQAEGQAMGDLLMASAAASLGDGESKTVNLELERKVLELSTVTISQVPDEVTAVTVSVAPFYSGIRFNGSYVDESPLTCTFALAESATAGVWEAAPHQLAFPSKGVPTITVTFTRGETGSSSYTYTAENALTANNRYNISGTYTEPLGVTLEGAITLQAWTTDPSAIPFDFDESNAISDSGSGGSGTDDPNAGSGGSGTDDPNAGSGGSDNTEAPVAGQTYKGCYVVSVDNDSHSVVLLSNSNKTGIGSEEALNSYLAGLAKPVETNSNWRLPTFTECQVCFTDANTPNIVTSQYYCVKDGKLNRVSVNRSETNELSVTFKETSSYANPVYLRPVIDITY